ncbi:MAG: gliding motility-associated C-terminal domain-containing protein [Bacteroidota bacterium]
MRQFDFFEEGVRRVFDNYELPLNDNSWANFQAAAGMGAKSSSFLKFFILPGILLGGLFAGMQSFGDEDLAHNEKASNSIEENSDFNASTDLKETLALTETKQGMSHETPEGADAIAVDQNQTNTKGEEASPNNYGFSQEEAAAYIAQKGSANEGIDSGVRSEIDEFTKRKTVHFKGTKYKLGAPYKFTPNNDNRGDEFMPTELSTVDNFVLEITDLKGDIVFKSKEFNNKWKGFILDSEKKANQGNYSWRVLIITDKKQEMYQGKVKLFR